MATSLTPYTGNIPDRATDTPIEFADNVFAYQTWLDENNIPEFNISIDSINDDVITINGYKNTTFGYMNTTEDFKDETLGYRNETEIFKDQAAVSANYVGAWSAGTYDLGVSVSHGGYLWGSDIASNTSEPGVSNWTSITRIDNFVGEKTSAYSASIGDYIKTLGAFTITFDTPTIDGSTIIVEKTDLITDVTLRLETLGAETITVKEETDTFLEMTSNIRIIFIYDLANTTWRIG